MSSYTLKKQSPETLKKMATFYKDYIQKKVPQHALFQAKHQGVTITAYKTGSVLFQGNQAETEAARWTSLPTTATPKKTSTASPQASATLPRDFSHWSVIGSDEVGNGSYFGPLVVCAAYVSREQLAAVKALGVKDSKLLKDSDIQRIASKIQDHIPHQLLIVSPSKYNDIQPTYNATHMKVALHNQAIRLLSEKIAPTKPEGILIDQFTSEKNYRKYLASEAQPVTENLYFQTKGEGAHLAVAAASILCRNAFLVSLEQASQELGYTIPSGAGHASDTVAARLLKQGGMPLLRQHAKLHFANTQKALKLAQR